MPGKQESMTPASAGSESLRASAAEFIPNAKGLRATALSFVPNDERVYQPRRQAFVQHPGYYPPPRHLRMEGSAQNENLVNPVFPMDPSHFHFQHDFNGAPMHPSFYPGMAPSSMNQMHDSRLHSRRQPVSPVKAKAQVAEQSHGHYDDIQACLEPKRDHPAEFPDRASVDDHIVTRIPEAATVQFANDLTNDQSGEPQQSDIVHLCVALTPVSSKVKQTPSSPKADNVPSSSKAENAPSSSEAANVRSLQVEKTISSLKVEPSSPAFQKMPSSPAFKKLPSYPTFEKLPSSPALTKTTSSPAPSPDSDKMPLSPDSEKATAFSEALSPKHAKDVIVSSLELPDSAAIAAESDFGEPEASQSVVFLVNPSDVSSPQQVTVETTDLYAGGEPVIPSKITTTSTTIDPLVENLADSTQKNSCNKEERRRYTIDEIMVLQSRFQAEKEAVRGPPAPSAGDKPAKYSVEEMLSYQSKFSSMPMFFHASLDCIGSRHYSGGGSSSLDRRSSVDRHGYNASSQRDRGARSFEKAKSRDVSRTREISRSNFGNLQGTVKPIDDRESRRRPDREKDRFDGNIRAPEPQFEPLQMSESRYVVRKDVQGEELALRQVQSVLNKLTPEKFDRLVTQLIELIMNHLEHLEKIIGLVFDKAVNEFNFAQMYSDLCHCLHKRLAYCETEVSRFRVILLERCRLEFESRSQFPETLAAMSEEERETAVFLSRRRSRGLLTFIGNLFNRQLLHFQVINRCLAQLTPHTSIQCGRNIEWDIEDTCTLWTVIGKKFASLRLVDVQKVVDVSFQIVENVIDAREVSSRMVFMLQDLLDLRNNRWEPRREVVVASTLAEVHKKAAQEALAKERAAQKVDRSDRHKREERDSRFDNRRLTSVSLGNTFGSGNGRSRHSTVDGWTHKISKSKQRAVVYDQPIRVSHSVKDIKPCQSSSRIAEVHEVQPVVNAFTLLGQSEDDDESHSTGITSEEIEGDESSFEASASDQEVAVDEASVRSKIKRMVEEFVSIEDYKEVILATDDLCCPSMHHLIVAEGLAMAAEGNPKDRELIPKMLLHIFKQGKLSTQQVMTGLLELLEFLEDLEIDIPKIRNHTDLTSITRFKNISLKTLQSIQCMNSASLLDLIRAENIDLHIMFSSLETKEGSDLSSFLSANGLESLLQCSQL